MLLRCVAWRSGAAPTTNAGHAARRRAATSSMQAENCSSARATSTPASATWSTKSGVGTRGAFYHHFKDKAELFRAVFEEVERDLTLRSLASPPHGADPWERLTRGLHGFLESALEPEVQRIMLARWPGSSGLADTARNRGGQQHRPHQRHGPRGDRGRRHRRSTRRGADPHARRRTRGGLAAGRARGEPGRGAPNARPKSSTDCCSALRPNREKHCGGDSLSTELRSPVSRV